MKKEIQAAAILGLLQFLSWGICTVSWRAVSQANIHASIITDTTLGTLNFFIIRRIAKSEATTVVQWIGYTVGGVLGTISGIYFSIWWLGR